MAISEEELNRKMVFIVEHQVQFSADIQVMREVTAADTLLLKEETKRLAQTRTDEKLAEVAERLNIFIGVVERHIGGNGNQRSEDRP